MSSLISPDKIKVRHFHRTKRFIDDLCAIIDEGEFGSSVCDICSKELELKVKNQSDRATLLNLDISIKERNFTEKIFDKRDSFPFSIVRILI